MGVLLAAALFGSLADERLMAIFQRWFDASQLLGPVGASRLGDHRYDDRLDDVSDAARAAGRRLLADTLAELAALPAADLSPAGRVDREILRAELARALWGAENEDPFVRDPRAAAALATESVYVLFSQSTRPKAENLRNAAARMRRIPAMLAAARKALREPSAVATDTAVQQAKGAVQFFRSGVFELAGETPGLSALAGPAQAAAAALAEHAAFLEKEVRPRANGEWRLGAEKFRRKLDLELDAGLSAEEVLAEARREFARVESEMAVVARLLWARTAPGQAVPPDDPAGRRELVRRVLGELAKKHATASTIADDARKCAARCKEFIARRGLLRLPDPDRCTIIEMPEFQRGNTTAYLNPAPPLDPQAGSYYAISPPPKGWDARRAESLFQEYNDWMLHILTIHEAYPGHYVQLEYSNRHPSPIRRVLQNGVFAEGWAVHTEQMMLDEGYGDGDLALRLHQLKFYLRAVCNAILDHEMHAGGMSDDAALKLLVEGAFQTEGEARLKVVRAKQTSCQLSTYFVGRTAFHRLRQAVQREQGEKFDLGRYHEAVLAHGTIPVKHLPALVRARLLEPR